MNPPTEIELWIGILIQFVPVVLMMWIGMLVADKEADKNKAEETGEPEAYELSWTMFILYGILGSVFAMVSMITLLEDFVNNFWLVMAMAGGMGLVFRIILPELQEIMMVKLRTILQAMFK